MGILINCVGAGKILQGQVDNENHMIWLRQDIVDEPKQA